MWKIPIVLAASLLLSGCVYLMGSLLGESESTIDLYNPQTHEVAVCGRGMHRGGATREELDERDKCLVDYGAKGFRVMTRADSDARVKELRAAGKLP